MSWFLMRSRLLRIKEIYRSGSKARCCFQSIHNLNGQIQNGFDFHRPPDGAMLQRHAVEQFDHHEGPRVSSPISWIMQMLGWFSAEAARR
jgi:hypothetical protein